MEYWKQIMNNPLVLVAIGVFVGLYGGVMGLGGGTVMIPIMVFLLGFTQHEAVGTSLAVMLPPVTLPAVIQYYRQGNVKLGSAGWMAIGFVLGAYLGGWLAHRMSDQTLKLFFGFVLTYVAGHAIFGAGKDQLGRTMVLSAAVVIFAAILFGAVRWYEAAHR